MTADPTTIEAIWRDHHDELLRSVAARVTASWQVIEDACQTAWMRLCDIPELRLESVGGWLFTVARREAIHLARREARERSLERHCEETGTEPQARCDLDAAVRAREALSVLAALPERQRTDLALLVAGFSYREIGALRGATYTNVNKQIAKARAGVRDAH